MYPINHLYTFRWSFTPRFVSEWRVDSILICFSFKFFTEVLFLSIILCLANTGIVHSVTFRQVQYDALYFTVNIYSSSALGFLLVKMDTKDYKDSNVQNIPDSDPCPRRLIILNLRRDRHSKPVLLLQSSLPLQGGQLWIKMGVKSKTIHSLREGHLGIIMLLQGIEFNLSYTLNAFQQEIH